MEPTNSSPINQNIFISGAIVIAGALVAGAILYNGAHYGTAKPAAQPSVAKAADVSKVKTDGEPYIGKLDAPVTIAYWSDYQCPFCKRHELDTVAQIVKNYVDTGKARIIFKDYAFLGDDSYTVAKYSSAVWEVSPDKFYAWHKHIYTNQGQEHSGWATKEALHTLTAAIIGETLTKQVEGLVATKGAEYKAEIDADKAEGSGMGVSGTPGTIIGKQLIGGAYPYSQFHDAIETALKDK